MDDGHGGGVRGGAAEELVLRTVAGHAEALLRTARRFSLCADDAQDAYQRALEIFMRNAARLEPARAPAWLHVVVKHEAQAIRRSRSALVSSDDVDFDQREARSNPTPDERLAALDLVGRSAEALQRLKPQELRALWLKAQGHSYNEIGAITGWSYTKVNRCLTEGRRSFLERYAAIESGAECERWLPVISAMVDGEATSDQLVQLRPHLRNCPGCRSTLRALHDSSRPLAAVLPVPLVVASADSGEQVANVATRVYEIVVGGLHDRAAASVVKVQALIETATAGKAAAIAGAAAAVATGGYATVERGLEARRVDKPDKVMSAPATRPASTVAGGAPRTLPVAPGAVRQAQPPARGEFEPRPAAKGAPEFASSGAPLTRATAASVPRRSATAASPPPPVAPPAPEFATPSASPEFGG